MAPAPILPERYLIHRKLCPYFSNSAIVVIPVVFHPAESLWVTYATDKAIGAKGKLYGSVIMLPVIHQCPKECLK